jgi:hypothetical protein
MYEREKVMAEEIERLRLAEALKREAGVVRHILPRDGVPDELASKMAFSLPVAGIVWSPDGRTEVGLATLAHEAGHVATMPPLGIKDDPDELLRWEYAATRWGHEAIRRNGGTVTQFMMDDNRSALAGYARNARGPLPDEIAAFLNGGEL